MTCPFSVRWSSCDLLHGREQEVDEDGEKRADDEQFQEREADTRAGRRAFGRWVVTWRESDPGGPLLRVRRAVTTRLATRVP
jgi:hypothetical protein